MRLMSGQYSSPEALEEDCTAVGVPTNGHMYTVVLIDELAHANQRDGAGDRAVV